VATFVTGRHPQPFTEAVISKNMTREAKPASLTKTEHHKTSAASGSIITRARGSTYEASLNFTSTSKFFKGA